MSAEAPSQIAARLHARTVAVVGAGLAGLRAAWALQSAGARVVVVEARDQVGGKAAFESVDGFSIDRSLQLLSDADTSLLRWVAELDLGATLLPLRLARSAQLHRGRVVATDSRRLREIARTPGVSLRDRARLLRFPRLMQRYADGLDAARPELAADLDYRSVADFARLYLGRSVFERFVTPRVTAETLGDEQRLSRVAFLLQWQQSRRGVARPGIAAAGLGRLAQAAADRLDVRTGLRAQQLKELPSGRLALECSGSQVDLERADEVLEVDALVMATAAAEAGRLAACFVTPAERDFLSEVRFGPRITLSVACDRPLTGLPQLVRVPHIEGRGIEVMLVEPGVPAARAPEGAGLVTLCATQHFAELHAQASDDRIVRSLLGELAPIYSRLGRALRFTRLQRDPAGVPRFEVGAYRALARFLRVQQDRRALGRRLYFAGDYLAGPRFEDAVNSGSRAAAAVISDLS